MSIQLNAHELGLVRDILKKTIPERQVWIFGSRVTQTCKPHSDLDLCVLGDPGLSLQQLADLREAFSESDLPMRVDIVDWATITPEFRAVIEKQAVNI